MIPARYEMAKYEDVPKEIRDLFEKIKESGKGIYIYGAVGTGKTHIAYALKAKYDGVEPQIPYAMFCNTTKLLHDIRQDFDKSREQKDFWDDEVTKHEYLLILDDVGSEKISDWVSETFYLIVNERYNHMRPTIFTSNLPLKALSERIGDKTTSRIVEMCDVVELDGIDRRVKNLPKRIKIKV